MVNLKFINVNNLDSTEINDISEIFLSDKNPRFTTTILDKNKIMKNFMFSEQTKQEESNIYKLLSYEGDCSDLLSLIKSIDENGYKSNDSDIIYLVKQDNEDKKYIVAEGNRRILCLKLICYNKQIDSSKISHFNDNHEYDNETFFNNVDYEENEKTKEKNINEINNLISKIYCKNVEWRIKYKLIDDGKELLETLYGKHLVGEKKGMRHWPRSKYYSDLLKNFRFGIDELDEDTKEKIRLLDRDLLKVINDFKQAQFIYACFYFHKNYDQDELKIFDDSTIDEILENKKPISGLESNHSFNKVKNIIKKEFNSSENEFKSKYFDFSYKKEDKYIIKIIPNGLIKPNVLFDFLYNKWEINELNTRPLKNEKSFTTEVINKVINNIDINKKLSDEELDKLNEFKLSLDDNERIIRINKRYFPEYKLERFEIARQIIKQKNNFKSFWEKIKGPKDLEKIPYYKVFDILISQYESIDIIWINALASTIRTFIEQLYIWLVEIGIHDGIIKESIFPNHEWEKYLLNTGTKMHKRYLLSKNFFLGKDGKNIEMN